MASQRFSNPLLCGDTASGVNSSLISSVVAQDCNNPQVLSFIRIPLTAQSTPAYRVPSNMIILDAWLDVVTPWASGQVGLVGVPTPVSLGVFTGIDSEGRKPITLVTASYITDAKSPSLSRSSGLLVPVLATSSGAGVGEMVLLVGFTNFGAPD